MSAMHPPTDRRCQIYLSSGYDSSVEIVSGRGELHRCLNEGIRWEKWGGCQCGDPTSEVCEADYYSWECDGNHITKVAA